MPLCECGHCGKGVDSIDESCPNCGVEFTHTFYNGLSVNFPKYVSDELRGGRR